MKKKLPFQLGKLFWIAAILVALLLLAVGVWLGILWQNRSTRLTPEQEKLTEIRSCIEEHYLFETDATSQLTGLCNGLVDSLGDPYAEYFTPDELELFLATSKGELVGIGAILQTNPTTNKNYFSSVLPDGPAAAAGINIGDNLLAVGDMSAEQISLDILTQSHIMGEAGTQVTLTVHRPSTNETLEFIIKRDNVSFPSTEHRILENQTGYLRIFEFSDHMSDEFISATEALKSQGMEQLILDLRNNPGGSLQSAVEVADYLLPDFFVSDQGEDLVATIVSLKDKNGSIEQYKCTDGNSVDLPIVILVNENTSSASELLSGTLRDYGRGGLVGMNTFGKGVSQSLQVLSDGSAVKLTNMEYFTPSGFALNGIGLIPDVIVEDDLSLDSQDSQLEAALQMLEEIQQGQRKLPILVNSKTESEIPKAFISQARQHPCKTKHFALTRQEIEALLPQLYADSKEKVICRTDNWAFDEIRGYERSITLDFSLDEGKWIAFRFDPITEQLHQIELYLPTEMAVASTLDLLETIDPSMSPEDQSKLREKLPAYLIESDRTLNEILKKKDYSVYAGCEDGNLSVVIE